MKKLLLLALAAIGIVACHKGNNPEDNLADYTVIVYAHVGGDMDNTMEIIWEEIKDKLAALPEGTGKKVRVLALYKYGIPSEGFSGKYGEPGEVFCFELDKDTDFTKLHTEGAAAKTQSFKLYDPENIKAVLNRAKKELPAKEYILVFHGHGGGFQPAYDYPKEMYFETTKGLLVDDWLDAAPLTQFEIRMGIERSSIPHLKAIMFHDCLMGGMETLVEVAPLADYLIATPFMLTSENTPLIPVMVKNLWECTDFETAARKTFSDSEARLYDGYVKEGVPYNGNIELVKSAGLEDVCNVTRELATRLCELYPTQKAAIDKATCSVYKFYNDRPFFDLMDYASKLAGETGDEKLADIRDRMKTAFDGAVLDQMTFDLKVLPLLPSFSLSVVLVPHEAYSWKETYEYSVFHKKTGWGKWLDVNTCTPEGNPFGQGEESSPGLY